MAGKESTPKRFSAPAYYLHTVVCLLIMFGFGQLPPVEPLTPLGMNLIGIFLGVLYGWVCIEIVWPSLAGLLAMMLVGGMKPVTLLNNSFGHPIVQMMFFIFVFCATISHYGLSKFISLWFITRKFVAGRPWVFTYTFLGSIFILGGLTSASPAAIIGWSILYGVCEVCGYKKGDSYPTMMVFGIVFAAQIGQSMIPFKQVALTVFSAYETMSGMGIDYAKYMLIALLICAVCSLLFIVMGKYIFRPDMSKLVHLDVSKLDKDGSLVLSRVQKVILAFLFLLVITRVYAPFDQSLALIAELFVSQVSADRMTEIYNTPVAEGTAHFQPQGHDIVFRQVGFAYDKKKVLDGVSFTAKEGEVTALVGPSGSGKSTCARLAARLWDATEGTIQVGGVDISTVDPEALLRDYSMVFQDVVLFDDTVMENIRLGRRGATDEEVRTAAEAANCGEFIRRLPQGYDTPIGENGAKLSGGERQRISIARALLKDAPIVLLDEATASLDVENETKVQGALSRLLAGKTVLVIAHRMRTVAGADRIVVLDNGRVAEQGTPAELTPAEKMAAARQSVKALLHPETNKEGKNNG